MRATLGTHKDSGQTCGACQVNCARRVSIRCIARAGTSVGWSSVILFFFLPPSCVPWLHARYALPRYYGRSDSCRAVLRAAAAMNAGLPPTGLPAYFAYTSCHSVSNHPTVMSRPFLRSLFPSARVHCPAGLLRQQRRGSSHYGKPGLRDGLRSAVAGSSHRLAESSSRCSSTMILCYGLAVHLRQLPTSCRHDAVAFGYRPVILRPDGDFHPAM